MVKKIFREPFETIMAPIPQKTPGEYFAAKSAKGGVIGTIAAAVGIVIAGAIAANNPDRMDPALQKVTAGAITAVTAAILSGVWNWLKHRLS